MRKISSASSLPKSSNSCAFIKESARHHHQAVQIHSITAPDGSHRRAALTPCAQTSTRAHTIMFSKDDLRYEVPSCHSSSAVLAPELSQEQLLLFARMLSHGQATSTAPAARAAPAETISSTAQALARPSVKEGSTDCIHPAPLISSSFLHWLPQDSASDALMRRWVIEGGDIELGRKLGAGSTGAVYEGILNVRSVQRNGRASERKVAVKVMAGDSWGSLRREVLALGMCRHNSVVPLVGVCRPQEHWHVQGGGGGRACVVTELMEGGSLRCLLDREKKLDGPRLLRIATDIALGLHHLHSRRIVHMDLKTANIFLQHDERAVIGDMGCARAFHEKEEAKMDVGTYRWMAPEAYGNEGEIIIATPQMDVYGFGILLWELVTCKVPYIDYSPVQAAACVVMNGLRPPIPRDCFAPLKFLIEKCWAQQPSQRPTSVEILHMLHIISMHKPNWHFSTQ